MTRSEIRFIRSLADKQARTASGLFVAEGSKLIDEILASGWEVEALYSTRGSFGGRAVMISPAEMERISMLKTPNDSLATVRMPFVRTPRTADASRLSLALDGVRNPGNMGTIIRLADWFGIEDVYCSEDSADCFNPKVVQATMGAILRVRVHYLDLEALLARSAAASTPVYGTVLDGENIYSAPLTAGGIIVMGNEGQGISPACTAHLTHRLLIPPYPASRHGSESLNVAMATAVVCAEFRRRAAGGRLQIRRPHP